MESDEPGQGTILLVDDNPDIQTVIAITMDHFGYTVVGVKTGAEAIDCLDKVRPDVAIIDYRLPDATGIEIGQQIRQSSIGRASQVGLILFSGNLDADLHRQAREAGFDVCLVKPVPMNELKERIASLVQRESNESS